MGTSMSDLLVSVIIPTKDRPHLLTRAVESALRQTHSRIEVIIVIDGFDAPTEAVTRKFEDNRLRVVSLPQTVGGSEARNMGIRHAKGDWVGFLDDDDAWLPTKLARQLDAALLMTCRYPVVSCLIKVVRLSYQSVSPRRMPGNEPLCEYLFCQTGLFAGEGQLQTSAILTRRQLLEIAPFAPGLRKHQDTDWYIRVAEMSEVQFAIVPEVLSVWYCGEARQTTSSRNDWRYSLEWLRGQRPHLTARAYAGFISGQLAREASRENNWRSLAILAKEMATVGCPSFLDYVLLAGKWIVPSRIRLVMRRWCKV